MNTKKLNEVATIIMGQSPPGSTYNESGIGMPFYQGVTDFGSRFPIPSIYCTKPKKIAKPGEILFSVRAPIGEINVADTECATGRGIAIIHPRNKEDELYIEYVLKNTSRLWSGLEGTGSLFGNAKRQDLENFKIPWIDDSKRRKKIGELLFNYDKLVELNKKKIELLDQAAYLLYREWFVYLRFPGCDKIKIFNGLPEGFEKKPLSKLVTSQYGHTDSASLEPIGPKFLRGTDINKHSYIIWSSVPYCSNDRLDFKKYLLKKDDLIIIRMADPGKVGIIEKDISAVFASYLIRIRLKDKDINPYYLFYVLNDSFYQNTIKNASEKSTRKSASAPLLLKFSVLIPPKSILDKFVRFVEPLRLQINCLLDETDLLVNARDLLLPRLLNGEIVV
jgi:type I restriction enzyme S subunit